MTLAELIEKRNKLVADQRKLIDTAEAEKRSLTAEERSQYDAMEKDFDEVNADVERRQALAERERQLGESRGRQTDPGQPGDPSDAEKRDGEPIEIEFRSQRVAATEGRQLRFVPGTREHTAASPEYRQQFARYLRRGEVENRNLVAGSSEDGGYVLAPMQMVADFIRDVDDQVVIRQFARTFTGVRELGAPTITTKMGDAEWTTELAQGTAGDIAKFGKRELRTHPLAKQASVSRTLLRAAPMDVEGYIRGEFSRVFGETYENAYMNGDGVKKPLGLFVASNDGIPTSRDLSEDGVVGGVSADQFINAKHELKSAYLPNARWLMHRRTLREVRKLKDGNGQYLWQPGISADVPSSILEHPYVLSEWAPSVLSTGTYFAIFGDFRHYWILDWHEMEIQTLLETAAKQNKTEYIARAEGDGAPTLAEAFVRMKNPDA